MAFSDSHIFRAFLVDMFAGTAVFDLNAPTDTYKCALYGNSGSPDKDATSANTAYAVGAWITGTSGTNEVWQAGQWAQGGIALTGMTSTAPSTGVMMFDANDVNSGATASLSNVYGTFIYDDTKTTPVAKQGVVYNWLGGANTIPSGTFTVVWNIAGIFQLSI